MLAQEVILTWPAIAGGVASICAIIAAVFGGGTYLYRKLVERIAEDVGVPAREAADKLRTGNGKTVGDYVVATATAAREISVRLDELGRRVDENQGLAKTAHTVAVEAKAIAETAHRRIDDHIAGHRET